MLIVGIDPGLNGAIAFFDDGHVTDIWDMPTLALQRGGKGRRTVDAHILADWFEGMRGRLAHAFIEDSWSRPENGAIAAKASGRAFGVIEGILAAFDIPVTFVSPQRWKKALAVPAAKDGARARASQLLPSAASNWKRVKDDGRAEASLIALWGLQTLSRDAA